MKNIVVIVALVSSLITVYAGDNPKYSVNTISEDLKKDVNVVFREDVMIFKILSKSRSSHYVHQAITIFNEKGKHYASEVVGYNKLSKIKDFKGSVYDAHGKLIKKLKNSEIYDQSAFDGYSLYSDARLKAIDLSQGSYPYTVEWEYDIEYKYLFYIPDFVVVPGEKISVEHSKYTILFPTALSPRYKTHNINVEPTHEKLSDGTESLHWEFTNVKPIKFEPLGPKKTELLPYINIAPGEFDYDNYIGTMNSWDEFGQWIISLNKGRNVLPESTKQKINTLTSSLQTTEQKVKAVYEYLQNKTRYVSIQLGIGGYQPFEAAVVDKNGYGDCKALSNYMVSMLECIGIKSHYALIYAGESYPELDTTFPSSQFNHAIVAVPNGVDTLWLECTNQTNPFGYQGRFTGDRKALLITDQGAAIASTIQYSAAQNLQVRTAVVTIEMSGNAKAKIQTTYSGLQYENNNLDRFLNNQYDEQKKWVQNNTKIPSFDINSFTLKNDKSKIPSALVSVDLDLRRYATVSGKRIFLTPNLMNRNTYIPEKVEDRKTPVVLGLPYTDIDTIRYQIPEEIYPEFLPEPVKLQSRFGEYEASFTLEQGNLIYVRKMKMNKGNFSPQSYAELIDFYKNISKADNTKVVFMSKT
jgi:hypothetical protein